MRRIVGIWGEQGAYGNYVQAVRKAGGDVLLTRELLTERWDALLLPGGGDMEPWRYGQNNTASRDFDIERDEMELALIKLAVGLKRPILGICRGMQVINVYFGGTLRQDVAGHSAVRRADRLHVIDTTDSLWKEFCGARCTVNSAHHQAIDALGKELLVVQRAEDGVIEAVRHRTFPVWGVQWHPERLAGEIGNRLFQAFLHL